MNIFRHFTLSFLVVFLFNFCYAQDGVVEVINTNGSSGSNGNAFAVFSFGETFVGSVHPDSYASLGFISANKKLTTSIVDEEGLEYEVVIYPNPTLSTIQIRTALKIDEIQIYNNLGQIVLAQPYLKGEKINVESLGANMYLLRFISSGKEYTAGWIQKNSF